MLFKDRKQKLLVGYDLGDRVSQISCFYWEKNEPITISTVAGEEQYNIPTILCKRKEVNQWFYGKDAKRHGTEEGGIIISNLVTLAKKGNEVTIDGELFNPIHLLALFIKRSLSLVSMLADTDHIDGLMITVRELDSVMVDVLEKVTRQLGMDREKVFYQSNVESFYQFCLHQEESLWRQQVVVFDYDGDCMQSMRMEINHKTKPMVAFIDKQYHEEMPAWNPPRDEQSRAIACTQIDETFEHVLERVMGGKMVATAFLIGDGFKEEWCKNSLRVLCRNRRVFQGNNLYSKGACYAIREKSVPTRTMQQYIFLGEDKVKANIGMVLISKGTECYSPMLDAGINWFEAKTKKDVILESGNTITFQVVPLNGTERKELIMTLKDIPERPRGATRLRISLEFLSENTIQIKVKDLGFGEIFKSSELEWVEEALLC